MKNSVYWQKRAEQVLIEAERNTNAYLNELNRTYKNTVQSIDNQINKIFGTYNKGFTQKQAIEWLNEEIPIAEYNKLKEVLPLITDENYRKQLLMQLNAPAYRYRITRLQQIKQTILTELSKVADMQLKLSQQCFVDTLKHSYNKTMFNIQQGTGLAFEFAQLPQSSINRLLSAKWYGRNFSGSIWRNRGIVANEASKRIKQGVLSGQSIQQMSKEFMEKTYTDSMHNATRLIRTEVNYFCNQGTLESYREAELDQYEFCATLDLRTSDKCRRKDGIVFDIDKAVPGENYPPLHPYCRSTVIPVINAPGLERMNKRRVRNPVTGRNEVIDNISYSDWHKKYVKGNHKAVIAEKMKKNKISDTKQYEKYKVIIGKNIPKSIDKFQDLKYNNSEEYNKVKILYKDQKLKNDIKSDKYKKNIDLGKQGKHIIGHNNFKEGKSYLTISETHIQQLVDKYAGTGDIVRDYNGKWRNQEVIKTDKIIGIDVDNITGQKFEATDFKIHYGKNGVHIVPKRRIK